MKRIVVTNSISLVYNAFVETVEYTIIPEMLKNVVLHSVATAFASNVFPVPIHKRYIIRKYL